MKRKRRRRSRQARDEESQARCMRVYVRRGRCEAQVGCRCEAGGKQEPLMSVRTLMLCLALSAVGRTVKLKSQVPSAARAAPIAGATAPVLHAGLQV